MLKPIGCFILFCSLHSAKISYDTNLSPFMGANLIVATFEGLTRLENHYKTEPIQNSDYWIMGAYRFLTLETFWRFLGEYSNILQHEYFGHGWQIRNLKHKGWKTKGYSFDRQSIYTVFSKPGTYQNIDLNSVAAAGTQAQTVLASQLRELYFNEANIDGRYTYLYTQAALSLTSYLDSYLSNYLDERGEMDDSHDVKTYIDTLKNHNVENSILNKNLYQVSLIPLLDPFLWSQITAYFTYIFFDKQLPTPVIKWGSFRFMPSVCTTLSPFGPEIILEQYFSFKTRSYKTYIRNTPFNDHGIYGIGLKDLFFANLSNITLGYILDIWLSPKMEILSLDRYKAQDWKYLDLGFQFTICTSYKMVNFFDSGFGVDLSYKTPGYLIGFPIDAGFVTRLNFEINF